MKKQALTVDDHAVGQRLDRWLKRQFPSLSQSLLEKWARTGLLRVDRQRSKPGARLMQGQTVELPVFDDIAERLRPATRLRKPTDQQIKMLKAALLYQDEDFLVLNKPAGLAVQGGTKTSLHVDAFLDILQGEGVERPRIVHRLDKDTSGILLLARHLKAAQFFTQGFQEHTITKTYWAIVVGCPSAKEGIINQPILKRPGRLGEKMVVDETGLPALTRYRVLETAHNKVSLVEFTPLTGRTHQIRVHAAFIESPILGDGKYGGVKAHPFGKRWPLHLHALKIAFEDLQGKQREFIAQLPEALLAAFKAFGFSTKI